MIIHNPDTKNIYHLWHYCSICGESWTHSQGDWESIKEHVAREHKGDWQFIKTIPTGHPIIEKVV